MGRLFMMMTIRFRCIQRYKKTILLLLMWLTEMNLKIPAAEFEVYGPTKIPTAVSLSFGPSSALVVVVGDVSARFSDSLNGFFCFNRTSNGDCFSG